MRPSQFHILLAAVAAVAASSSSCWDRPLEPESESPAYADGVFSDDYDWDFQRTVTLELQVAEPLRPAAGEARFEVRHTVYGGPLLYQGTLSDQGGWARALTVRLPQHEATLTITVETSGGLVRQFVPIAEDGSARTVFQ